MPWRPSSIAALALLLGCQALLEFDSGPSTSAVATVEAGVATDATADSAALTLATLGSEARWLATNGRYVFTTALRGDGSDASSVYRLRKDGTQKLELETPTAGFVAPLKLQGLASYDDATYLVTLEGGNCGTPVQLWRLDGTKFTQVAVSHCGGVPLMAMDAAGPTGPRDLMLVVAVESGADLLRVQLPSTATTTNAGFPTTTAVFSTANAVYLAHTDRIASVTKPGVSSAFAPITSPVRQLVADEATVYWIDATRELKGNPVSGGARTAPSGGPTIRAHLPALPSALAQFREELFVTFSDAGEVWAFAKKDGSPRLLAAGQGAPEEILADDSGVYWLNRKDGTVMHVAR